MYSYEVKYEIKQHLAQTLWHFVAYTMVRVINHNLNQRVGS